MVLPHVVGALERVRDPADLALEYASFNVGNRTSTPENKKSASDAIELLNDNMMSVSGGASGDAAGIFDDDPMCMHSTVVVSSHSANSGSQ